MATSTKAGLSRNIDADAEQVVIRKAQKADLRRIAKIEAAVYTIEGPWAYDDFVADYESEGRYYLVATVDEKIIGYSACYIEDGSGELTMNTVLPEWRGKGIGTLMLEKRLQWLDERVTKIELQTHMHNTSVQQGYLKHGFVPTKVLKDYYGDGIDAQEMRRKRPN